MMCIPSCALHVLPAQEILGVSQLGGAAVPRHDVLRVFKQYDADRSGGIDAKELRAALQGLRLVTDGAQAAAVLAKYDADRSGVLELDEFERLVTELHRFASRSGAAPVQLADAPASAHGGAVLAYSLRSQLFVGETYTLEVRVHASSP